MDRHDHCPTLFSQALEHLYDGRGCEGIKTGRGLVKAMKDLISSSSREEVVRSDPHEDLGISENKDCDANASFLPTTDALQKLVTD